MAGGSNYSVRGFSPKRVAYLLLLVGVGLLPFHWVADYRGDECLAGVAFVFMVAALVLGYLMLRDDKRRFWPAAFCLFAFLAHCAVCKL